MIQDWSSCMRCELLAECRNKVVCGYGNIDAKILFITDKPGLSEDKTGIPMSGPAGAYFISTLDRLGLTMDDVWTTTSVACTTPEGRDPYTYELENCEERLFEEIATVDPDFIVAMGRVTFHHLTGTRSQIRKSQLKTYVLEFEHQGASLSYPIIVTYNPAYVQQSPSEKPNQPWHFMFRAIHRALSVSDELQVIRNE